MTHVEWDNALLKNLHGKVAIITGAAQGIGAEAVEIFVKSGAKVVFADVNVVGGKSLEKRMNGKAEFQECDISSWPSLLKLFKFTFEKYGQIDVVAANAGIHGHERWLEDLTSSDGELEEPTYPAITVNLIGMLYTSKLALHYFAKNPTPGGALTITGSASSYFDTAPLSIYAASKHGVLGFVRSIKTMSPAWNVRVNMIAPWMTDTSFAGDAAKSLFGDLPMNRPASVAQGIAQASADPNLNGKTFWVMEDRLTEIEGTIESTMDTWLGERNTDLFRKGVERLKISPVPKTNSSSSS